MEETPSAVAFLGLGVMGGAMAANLARAGLEVSAWNRTPGRPEARAAEGAGVVLRPSIDEAVDAVGVVMVCVADGPDVREVLLDRRDGVVARAEPGTLIVDFSTIGPAAARHLHTELAGARLRYLDAPVTGGDVGARNATLTVMVGGEPADLEEARPYLAHLASAVHLCGPAGQGQAMKLANQVLCALNLIGVAEALALAEALGADPAQVVDVCSTGAGGSWALSNLGPRIVAGDLDPGFMTRHMVKDLRLVAESCEQAQLDLPGIELAAARFRQTDPAAGTQAVARTYRPEGSSV